MPRFSVVISVYNKEKYIYNTLQAVLRQTFQDFEIVVLDDGSTDNSREEILKIKDKRLRFFSEENKGAGAGRNFVIKKAVGDYIALLDADDYWYPFYLSEQNKLIEKYPNEAVFATAQEIKKGKHAYPKEYALTQEKKHLLVNYFEASTLASVLHSSSTVLKRDIFKKVGYYNSTIKSGQDTDLYIRVGLAYPVVFSLKICSSYRISENSLFKSSSSLEEKIKLDRYAKLENENPALKKFLDLNRFSLAVFAKKNNDKDGFNKFYKEINLENLNAKQKIILQLPGKLLQLLSVLKDHSEKYLGWKIGVFK